MSRILITGGAGFIGSKLATFLLGRDYEVTVLDSLMFSSELSDFEMEKIISIMSDFKVFEKSQSMIEYHSELALDCINSVKDS